MHWKPHPIRSGADFEVSIKLRAPLEFAYRWATDYRSDDLTLPNKRWVLERTRDHVVFEDFNEDNPDGFEWRRLFATLNPPDCWQVECRGNRLEWSISYSLTPVRAEQTTLTIGGKARYVVPGTNQRIPGSRKMSSELAGAFRQCWMSFGPKLERDYLKSIRKQGAVNRDLIRRAQSSRSRLHRKS